MPKAESSPLANSVIDASKRLGVGRSTLYELISSGKLRIFKIGSRTLIPESELQRFVAEQLEMKLA